MWRIRNYASSANRGTNDNPRAYHDKVLDDVLPFKRWHVMVDSEDFGGKKDEWSQSAEHLHVQQQQDSSKTSPEQ